MPSASVSAKIEKQQSSAAVNTTAVEIVDNSSPIRQVLVIIEHKIRNLEKRKVSSASFYFYIYIYSSIQHATHTLTHLQH